MLEEERSIFSWEVPKNTSEICEVMRYAVLKQWRIPSISPEEDCDGYDHDQNFSSFEIRNYKTAYKITIERMAS